MQKLHIFVKKKKGNYKLDAELSFLTLITDSIRYLSKKKKVLKFSSLPKPLEASGQTDELLSPPHTLLIFKCIG